MPQIETTRDPSPADRQTVKESFYFMPMMERGKPILSEMKWVLEGRPDLEGHKNILPDYCYDIFDIFQRTYFKGFPLITDTILVTDHTALALAKTVEQGKKVVQLDWKNLGRAVGIAARCIRFADLESADEFNRDGDLTPEKTEELFTMIFGGQWVVENKAMITNEPADIIFSRMLNQYLATWIITLQTLEQKFENLAYHWSPAAMSDFNEGLTEGLNSFMDENGQLVGQSRRAGIYGFLLLAWPEIRDMLESDPKKTLTDLHEWMKPFMRVGLTAYIEINTLRDVCATPPSGIGLSMRPFKPIPSA